MSVKIGQLRERIILTKGTKVDDGSGGTTFTSDTTTSTVWADVNPITGKRLTEIGRDVSSVMYEVTIRKDANIVTNIGDYRMDWESKGNKTLKFHHFIDKGERDRFVKFAAVELEED